MSNFWIFVASYIIMGVIMTLIGFKTFLRDEPQSDIAANFWLCTLFWPAVIIFGICQIIKIIFVNVWRYVEKALRWWIGPNAQATSGVITAEESERPTPPPAPPNPRRTPRSTSRPRPLPPRGQKRSSPRDDSEDQSQSLSKFDHMAGKAD